MSLHCVASSSKHETGMRRPQQISQRVVNSSGNDVVLETRFSASKRFETNFWPWPWFRELL